jgi:hypothetical protein
VNTGGKTRDSTPCIRGAALITAGRRLVNAGRRRRHEGGRINSRFPLRPLPS